jgi:succinoglycan biosynthesis transport protein ExoP
MELPKFIKLLKKRKYVLLGVPLFAIGITYFLVRKMPDAYASKATMATGLVDQSEQFVLDDSKNNDQESKINQQFSNIMQMMQLKRVLEQVSYRLIIHDLSKDTPYVKDNKLFKELNKDAKAHALATFTELYRNNQSLNINIADHRGLKKVLESMGYDDQTLKKKLVIYRSNNSDYVNIEYESPSAELSATICNVECEESIKYYSEIVKKGRQEAVNFLDSILKQKKAVMDNYMSLLKNYKINNRVLNLNEQAKSFYGLLADFETKIELTEKDIASYKGAIENIDAKFNPKERKYMEGALTSIQQEIVHTKDILKQLNDDYITSNFSPKYKAKVDSMSAVLTFQINQANDKYIHNPLAVKQNLALEKVKLEIGLDIAKYSLNTLQQELAKLNLRFDKLVPHEAVIQSYEQSIDFASKEYIEILKKYNQTALESTLSIHLKQIEKALPGPKLASKKMLLMILAGLVSFILCLVVFFVLFYLDDSIGTVKELANKTDITALGYLPLLHHSMLNLQALWDDKSQGSLYYKNRLRDIRYEVDTEIGDHQLLLVTSMKNGEGKTIFTLSLAYAYSIISKKILVIDGNFTNASITDIAKPAYYLEDYLSGKITATNFATGNAVDIIGTYGTDVSLIELSDEKNITEKLAALNAHYDIVLIEIPALENLNKAKEWIAFGDKVVSVFQAHQTITPVTQQFVNYFISLQPKFIGWVLTKTTNDKLKFKKPKKSTQSS